MVIIRGEEYDATVEIRRIKDNLARHRNDLHALLHESEQAGLSSGRGSRDTSQQLARFGCRDLVQPSVLYPFLVILVLMFLLQFSGQGAVTFYAALIFEEAETALDPKQCAVVVGTAYLLSSILGLFLKKQVGRRPLLLVSELGMALSQLAMGLYFYVLHDQKSEIATENAAMDVMSNGTRSTSSMDSYFFSRWLPLPILAVYTIAYNVGMVIWLFCHFKLT